MLVCVYEYDRKEVVAGWMALDMLRSWEEVVGRSVVKKKRDVRRRLLCSLRNGWCRYLGGDRL